ncbi:MAG: purine-binding chemotaxis protein CheW [Bradyrhizobium sp. DFCI-1]|jgi:hypothetical protein|nr:MAG: purine-binding chemotaxis protein CheW [Bradyrhizobium sp. DFCI-1]
MRHGSARDLPPHWYRYLLAALIAWCVLAGRPVHATDDGVSERAALYEESSTDPTGQRLVGSAVWRVDPAKSDTQAGDVTVRAIAEFPGKFRLCISLGRNSDPTLPANYLFRLTFVPSPGFSGRAIIHLPGMLMKSGEQARGTPLQALAAKVVDNIFLVALSNVDAQRNANTLLLKERSWFDIPVIYADQRRAIIAIEKGMSGQKAIDAAIAAWEASPGGPVAQQPSSHGDDEASTCVARVAMSTQ